MLFFSMWWLVSNNMKYLRYNKIVGNILLNWFWWGLIVFRGMVINIRNGMESGMVICYCSLVIVLMELFCNNLVVDNIDIFLCEICCLGLLICIWYLLKFMMWKLCWWCLFLYWLLLLRISWCVLLVFLLIVLCWV